MKLKACERDHMLCYMLLHSTIFCMCLAYNYKITAKLNDKHSIIFGKCVTSA